MRNTNNVNPQSNGCLSTILGIGLFIGGGFFLVYVAPLVQMHSDTPPVTQQIQTLFHQSAPKLPTIPQLPGQSGKTGTVQSRDGQHVFTVTVG